MAAFPISKAGALRYAAASLRVAAVGLPLVAFFLVALERICGTPFWTDEIFSFFMVGEPDVPLGQVWHGIWDGRDGMMPAFYLVHYAWGASLQPVIAGLLAPFCAFPEEAAWRLPSLLACLTGVALLAWRLAKRTNVETAGAMCAIALLASQQVLWHAVGFRAYGMMFGFFAILLALLMRLCRRRSLGMAGAVSAAALALAFTHPLGIGFAAAACLGAAFAMRKRGKAAFLPLLALIPAAILLALYFPALANASKLPEPWGWLEAPGFLQLPDGYLALSPNPYLLLGAVVAILAGLRAKAAPLDLQGARNVIPIAAVPLGIPLAVWIFSQFGEPMFLNRYFLPVAIPLGILGALFLARGGGRWSAATFAIVLGILSFPILNLPPLAQNPADAEKAGKGRLYEADRNDDGAAIRAFLVTDNVHDFIQSLFYESDPTIRHFYLYNEADAKISGSGEPRRLANEINLVQAHSRTAQETDGKNGIPEALLLAIEDVDGFIRYLPESYTVMVTRSFDQRTTIPLLETLKETGWQPVSRLSVPPPTGSLGIPLERTAWKRRPPPQGRQ